MRGIIEYLKLLLLLGLLTVQAEGQNPKAETYDYIVVGSGPGGGPLAANLAKSGATVLILEAGGDQSANLNEVVPSFSYAAMNDPLMRWDFFVKYSSDDAVTSKFKHLTWRTKEGEFYVGNSPPAGATQLGIYYPRSGTLGGCSTHNAMASALGSDSDWDIIANLTGDKTWAAEKMTKLFQRIEHNDFLPKGTPGHGFDGYLNQRVIDPNILKSRPEAETMLRAVSKAVGQDPDKIREIITADLNNNSPGRDQQVGQFGFPTHIDTKGHRVTAKKPLDLLLADKSKAANLEIRLNSFATKVLFDAKGYSKKPRAIGVEYLAGQSMYSADPRYNASNAGVKTQVFANKEVIISGGTFNSPQLLKLSGIGPKSELTKFNIQLLVDLPGVGTNLHDNYEISLLGRASKNFSDQVSVQCTNGAPGDPCLALWQNNTGPYSNSPHLASLMFKTSKPAFGERDLFMWATPGAFKGFWPAKTVNELPQDPPNTFDFSMAKIHSRSTLGTVLLKSANPRDVPDINFRFFEDKDGDADLTAMAEGVEFGRKVMSNVGGGLAPFVEVLPCDTGSVGGCDTKQAIKEQAWSHHATSTCAIGADDDKFAVLDSKFRVRGTEGLRVVDASVFPRAPGGFPVLPTFIVSEKASDAILYGK